MNQIMEHGLYNLRREIMKLIDGDDLKRDLLNEYFMMRWRNR